MFRRSACLLQAGSSLSGGTRCVSVDRTASKALDWKQPQKTHKKFNPRDQFGLLCRGGELPQTEKLEKRGFENPWLVGQRKGEELLEEEFTKARKKWEMNADQFANAPVISLPFRAQLKMERQKRKYIRKYMRDISMDTLRKLRSEKPSSYS